ncbi:MAG: hypothetical protein FJ146_03030 [Deltaproteobacteria bacterium]|nr:hypothetical protein [Deltaproteobacteria bacterium]
MDTNQPTEPTVEITKKQRVIAARGQEVNVDYFLFSCLEQERLERAQGAGTPPLQWPGLTSGATQQAEVTQPFESLVSELCQWYSDRFPELTSNRKIDHEQLVEVVPAFVAMCRDLADLFKIKSDQNLPALPVAAGIDRSPWDAIEGAIRRFFSSNSHLFLRYLSWAHGAERVEEFVPGSRPPVGKYAPPPLPRSGSRDARTGRSDRLSGSKGKGDRGGKHEKPEFRTRNERPSRPDRDRQRPFKNHKEQGPQQEHKRRPRKSDEETAKLTDKAMAEVNQAIATLRSDSSVQEITLLPTNSFYRRIQHQEIVDAGFVSNSVGEGADRAVKITRK